MVYMDAPNIFKIVTAIITIIISFIAGFIELRLNRNNWLNRWFALFFLSASFGFMSYTIYHFLIFPGYEQIVIAIMILAQIFFNFIPISLIMTIFVLEKSSKTAMSLKYLGSMVLLFILMSFGYFIWVPELDLISYSEGSVNTFTEPALQVFVNLIRIALATYVVYKYATITRKTEGETKKRIQWFFIGVVIMILGLITNLVGGFYRFIELEILALIMLSIGAMSVVKGFFM